MPEARADPAVILLPAELHIGNAELYGEQLGLAVMSGVTVVIADMTDTTFCDSSGLRILVRTHQQATANGTALRVVVLSADVLRIFTLVGLDDLLSLYPSVRAALEAEPAPEA